MFFGGLLKKYGLPFGSLKDGKLSLAGELKVERVPGSDVRLGMFAKMRFALGLRFFSLAIANL